MASDLPSYSGNTTCPKCNAPVGTTWHRGSRRGWCCGSFGIGEHLGRVCRRYGYGWAEATADANADVQ